VRLKSEKAGRGSTLDLGRAKLPLSRADAFRKTD
jgi:hypothetical protein